MASGNYNITSPDSISITKSVQVNEILSIHKQNLVNVIKENIQYIEIIKKESHKTSKDNRLLNICKVLLDIKPNVFIDYDSLVQLIELFNDDRKPKLTNKIKGPFSSKKKSNSYRLSGLVKKISKTTKKSHTPESNLRNHMRTMMSGDDNECLTLLDEITDIDYFKGYKFKCLSVNALEKLIITQIDELIVMTEVQLELNAEESEKKRWRAIIKQLNDRLTELRKK
jgi:hypothetical protein